MTTTGADRLARELAELADAPREVLVARWQTAYGRSPTSGTRRELLVASAAWHLQARRLGGLSRETKRRLTREMTRVTGDRAVKTPSAEMDRQGAADVVVAPADMTAAAAAATATADPCGANGGGACDAGRGAGAVSAAPSSTSVDLSAPKLVRIPVERRTVLPGARLLRDWNGVTHAVDVVDGGYLYNGRTHRSLSAIARTITGAHWSGPRFFGL